MLDAEPWTCPACRTPVATPYCPACGEQRLHARDLTLRGLLDQAVEAFTSLDARLPRTVWSLIRRPGFLTARYVEGPRKPYVGPFALFLLANLLFVGLEALTSSNVFSTPLQKHLHNQPWEKLAQTLVSQRLDATGRTLEAYAPVFDQAVARNAQSLIILMVLPFAVLPAMIFRRCSRPFAAHLAFSLHFFTFVLVAIAGVLVTIGIDLLFGGVGLESQSLDNAISFGLLLVSGIYLYLATGRVYDARGARRVIESLVLLFAAFCVFLGYRFALFLITLYSV
jgi:hypothetical protein